MVVKLMLVEDVSKPKTPFELCGESEPFPKGEPFSKEGLTDLLKLIVGQSR